MWRSNDYLSIHDAYDWRDGGKACVLYAFTMLALFVQGRLYLSPLSLEVLGSLNILRPAPCCAGGDTRCCFCGCAFASMWISNHTNNKGTRLVPSSLRNAESTARRFCRRSQRDILNTQSTQRRDNNESNSI